MTRTDLTLKVVLVKENVSLLSSNYWDLVQLTLYKAYRLAQPPTFTPEVFGQTRSPGR